MKFETRAIHDGQQPDPLTGAVIVPVYQTSTYHQEAIGKHKGYEYSRTGNPTRTALETAIASLEEGRFGLAFASGLAAAGAVFSLLEKGDHLVAGDDMYGGTYRLLERIFSRWGITATYADVDDPDSFKRAIRPETKMIWLETPTNPLLKIVDIKKICALKNQNRNLIVAVDNTFASPYFQRPLTLGADIVAHSTTKYMGGHSDLVGGSIATSSEDLYQKMKFYQNAMGVVPGPWDCWLTLRGLKTLALRMREHEKNALYLAEWLSHHPAIEKVYYPGLKNHENHELAKAQMDGFGGMISIEIKGGFPEVEQFMSGLKIFTLAESLGGVESLVCYPARMTHGSIPEEERKKRGIGDNLVRLSVGIENKTDLLNDLEHALSKICETKTSGGH
ncbi:MAG: cystathionine gamma-synthase [Candidatus Wallbacteria bacterium]|nr:cystathionine gamma-synthase [Candidatus Wallbacteria bacterium]